MKPKSDNLFHFTKNTDYLKGILLNGLYPRYCLEDVKWLGVRDKFLAYPMVCFCDIPISRISDHTAFYGEYGLGLARSWGLTNRLTPVIYATPGSPATEVTNFLLDPRLDEAPSDEIGVETRNHAYQMLSLIKPIIGHVHAGSALIEKDFSGERVEYVPSTASIMIGDEAFSSYRDEENAKMEKDSSPFHRKTSNTSS